jgi:aminopeptidase-like protein
MQELTRRLYPICRSITGDGVRESLAPIDAVLPLSMHELESGTRVLDWAVPPECNVRDAWIRHLTDRKLVDFQISNLHVLNYSTPIHRRISREELEGHLHSMPDRPHSISYRTGDYAEHWHFCLSHKQLEPMQDADYEVCIDSTLAPGALTYAEHVVSGESDQELFISAHVCHPSLANDHLSGLAVAVELARGIAESPCGTRCASSLPR